MIQFVFVEAATLSLSLLRAATASTKRGSLGFTKSASHVSHQ